MTAYPIRQGAKDTWSASQSSDCPISSMYLVYAVHATILSAILYFPAFPRPTLALFLAFNFFFGKPELLAVPEMQSHLAFDMQNNLC